MSGVSAEESNKKTWPRPCCTVRRSNGYLESAWDNTKDLNSTIAMVRCA
jgi:hypothetical protein